VQQYVEWSADVDLIWRVLGGFVRTPLTLLLAQGSEYFPSRRPIRPCRACRVKGSRAMGVPAYALTIAVSFVLLSPSAGAETQGKCTTFDFTLSAKCT